MSTTMTAAGESLVARLQAEAKPLIIDHMIFAHIPGQDHTKPIAPGVTVPTAPVGNVVYEYEVPSEYRAYVNPNQVVYSAMLGSDVGDFSFNWQGLYCSEYDVLVAVATFPALEKRKYDVATGKTGNNLTRNFLLTFTSAREITGLTISADVWQLDFTVRLKGMDERTRLANFDLYGQGYFEGDGWLVQRNADNYNFAPGLGYVGGIRAALGEALPLAVLERPRNVYLSVCLRPVGSDRVAEVSPLLVNVGTELVDAADETGLMHYRQIVARINEGGTVTDLRPKCLGGVRPDNVGAVPGSRTLATTTPLTGGGDLSADRTLGINAAPAATPNYVIQRDAAGRAQVAAPVAAADIARKADVDAVAGRSISVTAPLTGGGSLAANRTIGINATPAATPNYVIQRDAAGRAQVAAPAAAADIARKADVDAIGLAAGKLATTTEYGRVKLAAMAADGSATAAPGGFGLGLVATIIQDWSVKLPSGFYQSQSTDGDTSVKIINNPSGIDDWWVGTSSQHIHQTYQYLRVRGILCARVFEKLCPHDTPNGWVEMPSGITDSLHTVSPSIAASATAVRTAALNGGGVGMISMLPFRHNALPFGWYFCNGTRHANGGAQANALNALSANFKADWSITNNGATTNVPNWFHGGRGPVMRAVNGSSRQVGSVEDGAIQNITGKLTNDTVDGPATGAFSITHIGGTATGQGGNWHKGHDVYYNAANVVPTAAETRMLNRGMTPAIFLGV